MEDLPYELRQHLGEYARFSFPTDFDLLEQNYEELLKTSIKK